jgi:Xaa-Pro aminopeptidase
MMRILLLALLLSAPAAAQTPVAELPGAGRAVDVETFRARRARLAERAGTAVIAVPAAGPRDLEEEVLQDTDFRQDDYFFYLTGIETPDAWLLLVVQDGRLDAVTLFLPPRNESMERWTGVKLGPGEVAARLTGIDHTTQMHADSLRRAVMDAAMRTGAPLYTVVYSGTRNDETVQEWVNSGRDVRNVVPIMDSLRVVKDELEIEALRRAITITTEGVKAGMRATHPGMWEYQLEAAIEYTFRDLGADRLGYPSIVGSGPNSTVLHYAANRRQMDAGDLIVVDVGAEYAQYTADVSRTFPVSGRFTERQKAIYDLVLGAQNAAIEAVKPGVTMGELNRVARAYMDRHSGDLCEMSSCSRYFIHGLGHWIGMRVHDVGDYRMPLESGMVFTIEPGIYIAEEQLGVRIEDDILVTPDGSEILSIGAPRTTDDIERLMQSAAEPQATGSN